MTASFTFRLFAAALLVAGVGSPARGSSIVLYPIQDTTIYSESDNSNAFGSLFVGTTAKGNARRALIQFDLTGSIPAGAIVNSVSLALTQMNLNTGSSATFELHPLLATWGEGTSTGTGAGGPATTGDATWNYEIYSSTKWATAGGDFGASSGTASFGTNLNTAYTFSSQAGMLADVQSWLDSPASNFGWILKAAIESGTSARELGSRDFSTAQRPTLTIDFTAVPEPSSWMLLGLATVIGVVEAKRRAGSNHKIRT